MRTPTLLFRSAMVVLGVAAYSAGADSAAAWADSGELAEGEREYFSIDLGPMVAKFGPQHVVSDNPITQNAWYQMDSHPRVVVPPGSEAYVLSAANPNDRFTGSKIVGFKPKGKAISGQFFTLRRDLKKPTDSVLASFSFAVDANVKVPGERRDFLRAKGKHFQRLWSEEMAGAAMFRHLATTSLREIGDTATSTGPNWPMRRNDGVDDSIQMMSGGRAVSENLQLDRRLDLGTGAGEKKPLADVRGVTVREIDWSSRLVDEPTELDPLAQIIPHDQHAVFLPSFAALAQIVDQGNQIARPAVQWLEPQSRKTDVLGFYQQQLGLPLNALTRQVGGALIGEVAMTGSDPYFRTGTDVAVLMQSKQPKFLYQAMMTQIAAQAATRDDVTQARRNFTGHSVTEWSTPERDFCSLIAVTEDAVVVANSMAQMMKVLNCADGKSQALAGLDEYRFFRQRYPRGVADESALVIISDATIRRWCGPAWRIAAARRTRARGTIAEMTMQNADAIVHGSVDAVRQLTNTASMPDAGKLWLSGNGVRSDRYGTLRFQTPISEMDMTLATAGEIKQYEDWRTRYERQWRNSFDPIALKLSLNAESMSADLSVIPLMVRTQYRWWVNWVGDARLKPSAGDHHPEAIASVDIAMNMQSSIMSFARVFLQREQNIDLLSWIDGSVSVYLDRDDDWMKVLAENSNYLQNDDFAREAPIGVFVPSNNNFRMTAFIVAARGLLEQFAPNTIRWEQAEHEGLTYVVGTFLESTLVGNANDLPLVYYVPMPDGLTVSLNRKVIERTIDRHLARKKAAEEDVNPTPEEQVAKTNPHQFRPQVAAKITGEAALSVAQVNYASVRRMSRLSWSNLPILNFLRNRYPERDPADVYQQLLGEELTDPADGEYQWVEKFQTYESTNYGHHLAPQRGPAIVPTFPAGDLVETSLSFDDGGLRALMTLTPGGHDVAK